MQSEFQITQLVCPGKKIYDEQKKVIGREPCYNTTFVKRGTDKKHSAVPQSIQCSDCGKKSYPHTTRYFNEQAMEISENLLLMVFNDYAKQATVAEKYFLSESALSKYVEKFTANINESIETTKIVSNSMDSDFSFSIPRYISSFYQNLGILTTVDPKSSKKQQLLGQTSAEQIWCFEQDISGTITLDSTFMAVMIGQNVAGVLDYARVIVMDETFLTIGGLHYYLIVAVSKEGDLLSWALTRTRTSEDLDKVFQEALRKYPFPGIVLTDYFGGYRKMIKKYPYPIIHIAQVHKHPHNKVIIYQRHIFSGENKVIEIEIGSDTDIFATSGTKQAACVVNEEEFISAPKAPGRPKGSKNRPKEVIQEEKREKIRRKKLREEKKSINKDVKTSTKRNKDKKKKRGPGRPKGSKNRSKKTTKDNQSKKGRKDKQNDRKRKNVFNSGKLINLEVNIETNSLDLEIPHCGLVHDLIVTLLYTVFLNFKGFHLTSNYVENFFFQFKHFRNRGRRVNELKFLDDFQIYVVRYLDRVHGTANLKTIIKDYLKFHPPTPGFGYRELFEGKVFPILSSVSA